MKNSLDNTPVVGLLYNPAVPFVIQEAGDLVEYVGVIPERYWHDIAPGADRADRFRILHHEIETFKRFAEGRVVAGHGIGLSLPSAVPIDQVLLEQVAWLSDELGLNWYSEHLTSFMMPDSHIPNAQAGVGLPVVYDEETVEILAGKLQKLRDAVQCPVLMENGSIFTAIPEMEMTEPEFFDRLYREANCGMLLDLHNLFVTWKHGNVDPEKYLEEINPDAVQEIHVAGGDVLAGFYIDSHSGLVPEEVWSWAQEFVPRFKNLRAITFEFQESFFEQLGVTGIARQLERMHGLAESCSKKTEVAYA